MLPRPVLAISSDKSVRKIISVGLMAAGTTVQQVESISDIKPGDISESLVVLHIEDSLGVALVGSVCERMEKGSKVIVVLNGHDLEATVSVMQASTKVSAVLVSDGLTSSEIASAASKLLYGDIFGLEKLVPWGTRIYSTLVGSYNDKSMCISEMSEFAGTMGVRRKYREAIEQCADEMLMNALYDAPVDEGGKSLFADVEIRDRIKVQVEEKVIVQYACSDRLFMLSVRDNYGTLTRSTVLQYLDKCLHAEQQIDRKTHGAGLGLYLMAAQCTKFIFNVLPGVATECICTFDLKAPKVQLNDMSMYFERIDARGRLNPGRPTLLPGGVGFPVERRSGGGTAMPAASKGVVYGLSAAIALLLALIALVAYPRFTATTGKVRVSTHPAGATITLDGRARGNTAAGPLLLSDVALDGAHHLEASLEGYSSAESVVKAERSKTTDVVLNLVATTSTLRIHTDPEGAQILIDGKPVGNAPVSLDHLAPESEVTLIAKKTGYSEVEQRITVPKAGQTGQFSLSLSVSPEFASVSITSDPPGATILQNGELLAALTTPLDGHLLRASTSHQFTLMLPGYKPAIIEANVAPGAKDQTLHAQLEEGGGIAAHANVEGVATVKGVPGCRKVPLPMTGCAVDNGSYELLIESSSFALRTTRTVEVKGNVVDEKFAFGFIDAAPTHRIKLPSGRLLRRRAVEPGTYKITVVEQDSGESQEISVTVAENQQLKVP